MCKSGGSRTHTGCSCRGLEASRSSPTVLLAIDVQECQKYLYKFCIDIIYFTSCARSSKTLDCYLVEEAARPRGRGDHLDPFVFICVGGIGNLIITHLAPTLT